MVVGCQAGESKVATITKDGFYGSLGSLGTATNDAIERQLLQMEMARYMAEKAASQSPYGGLLNQSNIYDPNAGGTVIAGRITGLSCDVILSISERTLAKAAFPPPYAEIDYARYKAHAVWGRISIPAGCNSLVSKTYEGAWLGTSNFGTEVLRPPNGCASAHIKLRDGTVLYSTGREWIIREHSFKGRVEESVKKPEFLEASGWLFGGGDTLLDEVGNVHEIDRHNGQLVKIK